MLSNFISETRAMLRAQARLFINVDIAEEMYNNDGNYDNALDASLAHADALFVQRQMFDRRDRYYVWCEKIAEMKKRAHRRLNDRLSLLDAASRPYDPSTLGHMFRSGQRSMSRNPFTPLAEAVRAAIKSERAGDRAEQRTSKQRLLDLAYNCGYTALVLEVVAKHWPSLHIAVANARSRFDTGHWKEPVWAGTLPDRHPEHFVHASRETPGNVAFYVDTDKLEADKLTSMKPGRYLSAFYGDVLTEEQIKQWANKQLAYAKPAGLKFVGNDDPLGWVWVYENSKASCMRYNRSDRYISRALEHDRHPVTVYAHPENNLALAYIMLPGEVEDRTRDCHTDEYIVGARTIVNTRGKTYLRIYGAGDVQDTTMREALERAGYTQSKSTLCREKLRLVEVENGYLCPYLDGNYTYVSVRSSHLLVGDDGMSAHETKGYVCDENDENRRRCDYCGESYDEDDGRYVDSVDAWVCDICTSEEFAFAIGRRGNEELHRDDSDEIIYCEYDGRYYVTEYLSDNGMGMDEDGDVYPEDQLVMTEDGVYHKSDAVELTYEFNDYGWVRCDRAYCLPNGETCHVDDADKIAEIEALEQEAA